MLEREKVEGAAGNEGVLSASASVGMGVIAFMPLAQGVLTSRYLSGVPSDSRAASASPFLEGKDITERKLAIVVSLNAIAKARGQSLAQMAIAWTLRDPRVTSALIGASRPEQIEENAAALAAGPFSADQLAAIDRILAGGT